MVATKAVTIVSRLSLGNMKGRIVDVDTTIYGAAGISFTAAELELQEILFADFETTENGYDFSYSYTGSLLKIWFFDYDAGADGASIDFTDTGDAGTCRGLVLGF